MRNDLILRVSQKVLVTLQEFTRLAAVYLHEIDSQKKYYSVEELEKVPKEAMPEIERLRAKREADLENGFGLNLKPVFLVF